jgi:glycosyltransferase involved in cell wall biosynthesis
MLPTKVAAPERPLLITTQHPEYTGGVLALLRAFLRWARQEGDLAPALAYNPLRPDPANAGFLCRGRWSPRLREESWDGMPAYCVGRLLPAVESWSVLGNRPLWRGLCDRFDLFQVVCGYAVTGLPLALSGKRFVIWAATSMDGDKRARLRNFDLVRRVAHRLQYRELLNQERFVLQRAAWVLALSPHTRDELLQRGAHPDRLSVLPCPVDAGHFAPAAAEPDPPAVLWTGRHDDPRKNTALLLRAFARLAPAVPAARLLLAGSAESPAWPRLVRQLRLEGRVEFLGHRPDAEMPAVYRRASVFAIPSDQEGLCIAGLEAMAAGLPVVSTRCGGPEAFVLPERTGLLVDPHDERQLADALHRLLTDAGARRRLGREARRLVEEAYSFGPFARQLRSVYASVWPEIFTPESASTAAPEPLPPS